MTTSSQPAFSDILPTNFIATAHPNANGSYYIFYESINAGGLKLLEVTDSGPKAPQVLSKAKNFVSRQKLGATWSGTNSNDITLFYMGGQRMGLIYQLIKVRDDWQELEVRIDETTYVEAGQDAYIGCTTLGSGASLTFNIYYIGNGGEVKMAKRLNSQQYWTVQQIPNVPGGLRGGPLAVAEATEDALLAYTGRNDGKTKVLFRQGANAWTQLSDIRDIRNQSPLAVTRTASGGVYNVFHRSSNLKSNSVSVALKSSGATVWDIHDFSTTNPNSNFAAVTVNYRPPPTASQRFLAVSAHDGFDALFQYRQIKPTRWVIPQGLVITNGEFFG
jgi:hypothetical protein